MEVAKMILNITKKCEVKLEDYIEFTEDRPYNDGRYYISNEKLKELGWKQKIGFEEGLKKLISK
jgi:dTDP-D-glucose 4,6-dehydratase